MNKITIPLYIAILMFLTNCDFTDSQGSFEGGVFEVSLSEDEINRYVPDSSDHLSDSYYINEINNLIEDKVDEVFSDTTFVDIIKAIAWTESRWKHYFEDSGRYYVSLGDDGHSLGIMQIHDEYHGQHPNLQDNLTYGIDYGYEKYLRAGAFDCDWGSNAGSDIYSIVRRTYAQYNGGNAAMCRDSDGRDNNIEQFFIDKPWENYL